MNKKENTPQYHACAPQYSKKMQRKPILSVEYINSNFKTLKITEPVNPSDEHSGITKFLAMDCEMVGGGSDGRRNLLARVSIVNSYGNCVYDRFVKPREAVTNYRTAVSGIREEDLIDGEEFDVVRNRVRELIKGRILVGHSVVKDLWVIFLSHPKRCIRDTSGYKPFVKMNKGKTPSLKFLAQKVLGVAIQDGEHNSIEDARAAMKLYCVVSSEWEENLERIKERKKTRKNKTVTTC